MGHGRGHLPERDLVSVLEVHDLLPGELPVAPVLVIQPEGTRDDLGLPASEDAGQDVVDLVPVVLAVLNHTGCWCTSMATLCLCLCVCCQDI